MTINVTLYRLEFKQGTSFKFYNVFFSNVGVLFHWGRIGSTGQHKYTETAFGRGEAENIAMKQVWAKADKGYEIVQRDFTFEAFDTDMPSPTDLLHRATQARRAAQGDTPQVKILAEYDELTKRMHVLIEHIRGAGGSVVDSYEEFSEIEQSWAKVADAHSLAETTIGIVKQRFLQELGVG